ncbi:uncharacterized protein LOC144123517 [Amblyomma americanum]
MAVLAAAWLALASRLLAELGPLELTVEVLPSLRVVSRGAKLGLGFPFELILATSQDLERMSRACRTRQTEETASKSEDSQGSSASGTRERRHSP